MKRTMLVATHIVLAFVLLFGTPTTAQAAVLLTVNPSKAPGVYYTDGSLAVALTSYPGSFIVYTTNGTTPVAKVNLYKQLIITNGIRYTGTLYLASTKTVKAIAVLNWYTPASSVVTLTYELYRPTALGNAVQTKFSGFNYNSYSSTQTFTALNGRTGSFTKALSWGGINCTWYTYVRIRYNLGRAIVFSVNTPLNGKDWYAVVASSSKQVKYGGSGALEALVKANGNRPVYNIMVSFPHNNGGPYGHVMLIDAIINGKVYYSDSFAPGILKIKNSLSEFKAAYATSNGAIVGVVHLK